MIAAADVELVHVLRAEILGLDGMSLPLISGDAEQLRLVAHVAALRGVLGDAEVRPLLPGEPCPCALLNEHLLPHEVDMLRGALDVIRTMRTHNGTNF